MNKIAAWLKDTKRIFTEGVKLYNEFGMNPKLKVSFLKGESPLKMDVLVYELSKLADVEPPTPKGSNEPIEPKVSIIETKPLPSSVANAPAELIELIVKRGHLANKKAIVHNTMLTLEPHQITERATLMAEMAAIRGEIEDITEVENFYKVHNKMPDAKVVEVKKDILTATIPTDKAELLILKKQLTELKSKTKAKSKKLPNGAQKVALEDKISRIDEKQKDVDKAIQHG